MRASWYTLIAIMVACGGPGPETQVDRLSGDPALPDCGFDLQDPNPLAVDPCLAGPQVVTLLGPEVLTPATGKPETVTAGFTIPGAGVVCVLVSNTGAAAARISVDGAEVFTPDDFNPHVSSLTARPDLAPGGHELSANVDSNPGSSLSVEIRFAPGATGPAEPTLGSEGLLGVSGLVAQPDLFSPADGNGVRDITTLAVDVTALATPGSPSEQFEFIARANFELAGGATCEAVRSLTAEVPLAVGTPASAAVFWDGRDAALTLVPDGVYFYRARIDLVRRKLSDGVEDVLDQVTTAVRSVTVDNTAPSVNILEPEDGVTVNDTIIASVAATDESGIASINTTLDTAPLIDATFPDARFTRVVDAVVDSALLSNGVHLMAATADDHAGNTAGPVVSSFLVENEPAPPEGLVRAVEPPSAGAGATLTIRGAGFDPTDLQVFFGDSEAQILDATTSAILVRVPEIGLGETQIAVLSNGNIVGVPERFRFLAPRFTIAKPPRGPLPLVPPDTRHIDLKLQEGCLVRERSGSLVTIGLDDLAPLRDVLAAYGVEGLVDAQFTAELSLPSEEKIDATESRLQERFGREFANLNLWFRIDVQAVEEVSGMLAALNALPIVELATPAMPAAPEPGTLFEVGGTPTPDLSGAQGYRRDDAYGLHADFINEKGGGRGQGVSYFDIETNWNLDHEDFTANHDLASTNLIPGAGLGDCDNVASDGAHGVATLGIVAADEDGITRFGLIGIASRAVVHTVGAYLRPAPTHPTEPPDCEYVAAAATLFAAAAGDPGDVVHLQQQFCRATCTDDPVNCFDLREPPIAAACVPLVFDAVSTAVHSGRVVVVAGGNGDIDLDSSDYDHCTNPLDPDAPLINCFDRSLRDSGAIYVGAGNPAPDFQKDGDEFGPPLARAFFDAPFEPASNYGERMDLQGWGRRVATAGPVQVCLPTAEDVITADGPTFVEAKEVKACWRTNDAELPPDVTRADRRYHNFFAGTSSASAIVAGAVVAMQGRAKFFIERPLTPKEMRNLLAQTGTPQVPLSGSTVQQKIGPLPNLEAANNRLEATFPGGRIVTVLEFPESESHSLGQMAIDDFDSDGNTDVAVVDSYIRPTVVASALPGSPLFGTSNVHAAFGNGLGGFPAINSFNSGGFFDFGISRVVALVPITTDDMAITNFIDSGDPSQSSINTFSVLPGSATLEQNLLGAGVQPTSIITDAFDVCGTFFPSKFDLAWTSDNFVHVVLGEPVGGFPITELAFDIDTQRTIPVPTDPDLRVDMLVGGDFDNDGCRDLIVAARSRDPNDRTGQLFFLRGAGAGLFFTPLLVFGRSPDLRITDMTARDLDSDGVLDLIMVKQTLPAPSPQSLLVLYGDDTLPGTDPPFDFPVQTVPSTLCCSPSGVSSFDVNEDGFQDVVVANSGEPLGTADSRPGLDIFLGCGDRSYSVFPVEHGAGRDVRARDVIIVDIAPDSEANPDEEILFSTSHAVRYFDPISYPSPNCTAP